ncbi:hypothetical protein [Mannheimia haemolytica]|uniref:hypothetical protein n=1 Tax=Mannheimia haemolytica TaxID=75985 RepID=UPI0015823ABE|nr:hypothetical protein [Mannheimia haemolytica]
MVFAVVIFLSESEQSPLDPTKQTKIDYADGLYFGGFLNGVPSQYLFFKDSGIELVSTGEIC